MARALSYLSVCSGIEAATVAWHPLGWTPQHDDGHTDGWIASAAAEMMLPGQYPIPGTWAWKRKHPDSKERLSRREQLVIATAMGLAEIERLDRASGFDKGLRRPTRRATPAGRAALEGDRK